MRLIIVKKLLHYIKLTSVTTNQLLLFVGIYIVAIFNFSFLNKTFEAIVVQEVYSTPFLITVPVFLLCLTIIILGLFSQRILIKPFLITLIIISSTISYATISYGTVFDYGMVQNMFETYSAEALSYINLYSMGYFLLFGIIPSTIILLVNVTYKSTAKEILERGKLLTICCLLATLIGSAFYSNYASVGRNNRELIGYIVPFKFIDATYKYFKRNYFRPPLEFKLLDTNPFIQKVNNRKNVTVLVVGETARSQNFSLNGYIKNTNKFTDKFNVVSFSNMYSCGTATAVSVPCMFSKLEHKNYDKRVAVSQQNVLDLIHLAGVDVLWVDNNSSCKGVCARIKTIYLDTNKNNPNCDGEYCFDEVLIEALDKKLAAITHESTLIVLHMIGSHGPTYFRRYPVHHKIFKPDCQRSDIQNCSSEELVNTYDNTIAYTDFVLSKIIEKLVNKSQNENIETSLLYVSDHGESLGEKGVYLHGLPYAFAPQEQTHIPMLFWKSKNQESINLPCLDNISNQPYSHDNLFDSVLSLMSINSKAYNKKRDFFYPCKSLQTTAKIENTNHFNKENDE